MATETNFRKSIENASEAVYDYTCTLCEKENKNTEAVKFCFDCQENLCSGCVEWHKKFPLMARHVLQPTQGQSANLIATPLLQILTEQCPKHPVEIIKMYCATHDKVACTVCTTIDHKTCNDVHYIPDVVDTLYTQQMNTDSITALLKALEKMKTIKEIFNKALVDLNTAKQTTLQGIQEFRQELNHMLDKLEQNTTKELDDLYQTNQIQWQLLIDKGTAVEQDLQKQLEHLQNTESNRSQQFILTKMSKESITLAETLIRQLLPSSIQITFSQHQTIKSCFEKLSSLGDVFQSIDKQKLGLYKVKESHKYNVKIKNDSDICHISGSCVLDSGHLLLADHINKKIKLFDTNKNAVTNHCAMPGCPRAVCIVSDIEAAVSLDNNTIQIVSIGNMLPTRILKMDHDCCGLAIDVDKMYITGEDNLYVYELNGKLLKTINKDQSGQKIFSAACCLTISKNNGNLHVADYNNGLITLDTQGQVVWKYTGSDLKGALSVCTDGYGNVFVYGHHSCNVLQLGHDGQRLGELIDKIHCVSHHMSVLFDKKNCRLIITSSLDDCIQTFSLE